MAAWKGAVGTWDQGALLSMDAPAAPGSFTGGAASGAAKSRKNTSAALWYAKMQQQRQEDLKAFKQYLDSIHKR